MFLHFSLGQKGHWKDMLYYRFNSRKPKKSPNLFTKLYHLKRIFNLLSFFGNFPLWLPKSFSAAFAKGLGLKSILSASIREDSRCIIFSNNVTREAEALGNIKERLGFPPPFLSLFPRWKLFNFYKSRSFCVTKGIVIVVFSIKKILLAECFLCIKESVTT